MKTPYDEIDPDAPPSAEEQAAASALARALEQGASALPPQPPSVADALDTAALLRQTRAGQLPPLDAALPVPAPRKRRWWIWPALAVPAAAVLLIMLTVPMAAKHSAPVTAAVVTPASRPPLPLLRAQAEVARGNREALAALDAEMQRYRATFFSPPGGTR